jgi:SnoaL-like domain
MDDLARLLGERACERLLIEYCRLVDFGEAGRLADLFTEDGVWTADELVLDGRDAIRTHFLRRQGVVRRVSRHFLANVAVDLRSADEADGLCYFANYRHDRREGDESLPVPAGLPKYTGEYHDRFVRTADGWRFAHHRVTTSFLRPPTPAPAG